MCVHGPALLKISGRNNTKPEIQVELQSLAMVKCCICWKEHSSLLPRQFHSFPSDAEKRKKWFDSIGYIVNSYKNARICSDHFKEDDYYFTGTPSISIRLKKTAIPSVFTQRSCKSLKKNSRNNIQNDDQDESIIDVAHESMDIQHQSTIDVAHESMDIQHQSTIDVAHESMDIQHQSTINIQESTTDQHEFVLDTCPNMLVFTPMFSITLIPVIPVTPTY